MRRLRLPLATLLGVATAVLPAVASSETSATIEAVNVGTSHSWSPAQVSVASGGEVTLSNATIVPHGVEWVGGPVKPTCASSVPVGTTPAASGTKWSGNCTFAEAGTYTFYCTVHGPEMTGTVTVSADGTTTTTMSTPTSSTTTTTPPKTTTGPATPTESSSGGPLLGSPAILSIQHGRSVKGTLDVSKAGVGDRLEVDLLASDAALSSTTRPPTTRVGRLVRKSLPAGNVPFAVALDAKARRALRRHRHLALTVRLTLTPFYGEPLTIARHVLVRR
jgi:plastocyanin